MTVKISREMGLTHREFFRTLPSAMGEQAYTIRPNQVLIDQGERQITITLDPEQIRKIALIRIPYCWVHFVFNGFETLQAEVFLKNFERYYQRGGG